MKYALATVLLVIALAAVSLFFFAKAVFKAGRDRLVEHVVRYARSYLVGLVFVLLSLLDSFVTEFEHIARTDRLAFDAFDWSLHFASAGAAALTVILAFLNQTNAQDRAKPNPPNHEPNPAPPPAGAA